MIYLALTMIMLYIVEKVVPREFGAFIQQLMVNIVGVWLLITISVVVAGILYERFEQVHTDQKMILGLLLLLTDQRGVQLPPVSIGGQDQGVQLQPAKQGEQPQWQHNFPNLAAMPVPKPPESDATKLRREAWERYNKM